MGVPLVAATSTYAPLVLEKPGARWDQTCKTAIGGTPVKGKGKGTERRRRRTFHHDLGRSHACEMREQEALSRKSLRPLPASEEVAGRLKESPRAKGARWKSPVSGSAECFLRPLHAQLLGRGSADSVTEDDMCSRTQSCVCSAVLCTGGF